MIPTRFQHQSLQYLPHFFLREGALRNGQKRIAKIKEIMSTAATAFRGWWWMELVVVVDCRCWSRVRMLMSSVPRLDCWDRIVELLIVSLLDNGRKGKTRLPENEKWARKSAKKSLCVEQSANVANNSGYFPFFLCVCVSTTTPPCFFPFCFPALHDPPWSNRSYPPTFFAMH